MALNAGATRRPGPLSAGQAWLTVTMLSVAYALSYADRIIINLLARPIKAGLGLNDTRFGLLTGGHSAFSIPPWLCRWGTWRISTAAAGSCVWES